MSELVIAALKEYGTKEIAGDTDCAKIMQWAKLLGFNQYTHDEIAWCSLFVNHIAQLLDYPRSRSLLAQSWLEVGEEVSIPALGDIIILWRDKPDSIYGHVGFYINEDENNYFILGGNQGNAVNITGYPKKQLLGFRRLTK